MFKKSLVLLLCMSLCSTLISKDIRATEEVENEEIVEEETVEQDPSEELPEEKTEDTTEEIVEEEPEEEEEIEEIEVSHEMPNLNLKNFSSIEEVKAQYAKGTLGFYESIDGDCARAAIKALLEGEYANLNNIGDVDDATNLENAKYCIHYLKEFNAIRALEGLDPLDVTLELMAMGQANANASAYEVKHLNQFNVGENLAWGYAGQSSINADGTINWNGSDPYYGWYIEEKEIAEYVKAHPDASAEEVAIALGYVDVNGNPLTSWIKTGHYGQIINTRNKLTGIGQSIYAFVDENGNPTFDKENGMPVAWYTTSQVFQTSIKNKTILTVDEYEELFMRYYNHLKSQMAYTITYDANGGSGAPNTMKVDLESTSFTIPSTTPTRQGYTFQGWSTSKTNTSNLYKPGATISVTGDMNLYAIWKAKTYKVTYDANGGSVSTTSKTVTFDSTYGTLVTPSRSGYTFEGWYTSATGGTKITESSKVTNAKDHTLYAHWLGKSVTVTYNANGGSVSSSSKTVNYGSTYGTLTTPTRTGYTFDGWYTAASSGTKITSSTQVSNSSNHTLYAHWTVNTYTIYYDGNGASGSMSSQSASYDQSIQLRKNTFTRTGYKFLGWSTSKTGSVKYSDEQSVSNIVTSGTVTLYAIWQANEYTVLFNANGGTGSMSSITMKYGTAKNLPSCTFTRTNYAFKGWSLSKSGAVVYSNTQEVKNLVVEGSITLYAIWEEAIEYTVIYDANGGSGSMPNSVFIQNKTFTLPKNTFRNDGYTFEGWTKTPHGTPAYSDEQSVINITKEKSITLYAVWKMEFYSITFDPMGGSVELEDRLLSWDTTYGELPTSKRKGYTFNGWYTSKDYTEEFTEYYEVKSNMTVYAKWTPTTYTITYNATGGASSPAQQTKMHNQVLTLSSTKPTRTGYSFYRWNTREDLTGTYYYAGNTYSNNQNVTLYAEWSANSYTITYNVNGGNALSSTTKTIYYGNNYGTLLEPKRTGYKFKGWYTTSSGGTRIMSSTQVTKASNHTIYAQWTTSDTLDLSDLANITVTSTEIPAGTTFTTSGVYNATKNNYQIKYGSTVLTKGTDYDISSYNGKKPTATEKGAINRITVTYKGKYSGTTEFKNISYTSYCTISPFRDYTYNGGAITPSPVIYSDGIKLWKNAQYTTSYSNNINIGTATVTIKGCKKWFGEVNKTFKIVEPYNPPSIEKGLNLNKTDLSMNPGETYTLKCTYLDDNSYSTQSTSFEWHSQYSNIASVDSNGNIVAKSIGVTKISATYKNGTTATCVVSVNSASKLLGYSVTYDGTVHLNYHFSKDDPFLKNKDNYILFKYANGRYDSIRVSEFQPYYNPDVTYIARCPLPAKDMMNIVSATLHDSNYGVVGELAPYSLGQYVQVIKSMYGTASEEYKNAKKLMTYGYYTQKYFNYYLVNTPSEINTTLTMPNISAYKGSYQNSSAITFLGATLTLKDELTLNLYCRGTEKIGLEDIVYKNGNGRQNISISTYGSPVTTCISITGLQKDLGSMFTIQKGDFYLNYGVLSYGYQAMKGNNADLKNLILALYALAN